ncbi:MAG: KpsF/GutQ family sugar-phosphate isomerase [Verrucomicrobiota bacterium]
MNIADSARRVIELEINELQRLIARVGDAFSAAVEAIKAAQEAGGKVVVVGVGKSYNIGHKIAATFNSTGATSVVLNSQNALHGDLGIVQDGDVVLALSYSGETSELLNLLPHVRRKDVKVVAITGEPDSTLARNADIVLDASVEREACPMNLAPTSSTTVMLVLGDALAMVLLESRGFNEEDFANLHPGGSLGRVLLTKVSDIMRREEQFALAQLDETVSAALEKMTAAKCGAAVIAGADGKLAGVFTHGDFVRAFQKDNAVGAQPVSAFMTADPATVGESQLAAEILQIVGKKRIDDVVVIDGEGCPVGLVDTQDLSRLRIL